MPRKRMIDPSFWDDLTVGQLSRDARLCFIGLLSYADDYGRIEVDPRYVKRAVFGFDDDLGIADVAAILSELRQGARNLRFYETEGRQLAVFLNWQRYQYIQKAQASRLPPPPDPDEFENATVPVSYSYDTPTVPVTTNRIERNRIEKNTAENARAPEEAPPPPINIVEDRLGKHGVSDNQIRKVIAAFQAKNHKLTSCDFDQVDTWLADPKRTVGILLGSWLYKGIIPPAPNTNGLANGLAPPSRSKQPEGIHEAFDEDGNFLYLALPDGTEWKH